ncbi:MAG: hypothetical protein LDL33_02170 [Desulfomonile sp.]|nr:hypothetical protein [Desulfomonile sp.]
MNRILLNILVIAGAFLSSAVPVPGTENKTTGPARDISLEDNCPESVWEARRSAVIDASEFRRTHPAGTWTGFIHLYRSKHESCPLHIRRAYLEEARSIIEAAPERLRRQIPRR